MAPVQWKDAKINVLDAPGTADFVGDLRNAIRAVDAVIVVVSAVDGVEVQTEYAGKLAVEEGLPRATSSTSSTGSARISAPHSTSWSRASTRSRPSSC